MVKRILRSASDEGLTTAEIVATIIMLGFLTTMIALIGASTFTSIVDWRNNVDNTFGEVVFIVDTSAASAEQSRRCVAPVGVGVKELGDCKIFERDVGVFLSPNIFSNPPNGWDDAVCVETSGTASFTEAAAGNTALQCWWHEPSCPSLRIVEIPKEGLSRQFDDKGRFSPAPAYQPTPQPTPLTVHQSDGCSTWDCPSGNNQCPKVVASAGNKSAGIKKLQWLCGDTPCKPDPPPENVVSLVFIPTNIVTVQLTLECPTTTDEEDCQSANNTEEAAEFLQRSATFFIGRRTVSSLDFSNSDRLIQAIDNAATPTPFPEPNVLSIRAVKQMIREGDPAEFNVFSSIPIPADTSINAEIKITTSNCEGRVTLTSDTETISLPIMGDEADFDKKTKRNNTRDDPNKICEVTATLQPPKGADYELAPEKTYKEAVVRVEDPDRDDLLKDTIDSIDCYSTYLFLRLPSNLRPEHLRKNSWSDDEFQSCHDMNNLPPPTPPPTIASDCTGTSEGPECNKIKNSINRLQRALKTLCYAPEMFTNPLDTRPITLAEAKGFLGSEIIPANEQPIWNNLVEELEYRSDNPPEVRIEPGSESVVEGEPATFFLFSSSPFPSQGVFYSSGTTLADAQPGVSYHKVEDRDVAKVDVVVKVEVEGNFNATFGSTSVPADVKVSFDGCGLIATLIVSTTDDTNDELDGSITATILESTIAKPLYAVHSTKQSKITVKDNDLPPPTLSITRTDDSVEEGEQAEFLVVAVPPPTRQMTATLDISAIGNYGVSIGNKTVDIGTEGSATYRVDTTDDDVDEADGSVTVRLLASEGYVVSTTETEAAMTVADNDKPVIRVTAGSSIVEGQNAVFTFTADASPSRTIDVPLTVNVTATGDYGITTGSRTVNLPATGTATLEVATDDDDDEEDTDGSVTVTLVGGSDVYDIKTEQSEATVSVSDNDGDPYVSITAGSAITEGGQASFTLTSVPAPSSPLSVSVRVANTAGEGDWGVKASTITVPISTSSGTARFILTTVDDAVDEADGSVQATIQPGAGYRIVNSARLAKVAVADNDKPRISIVVASEGEEGEAVTFRLQATPKPYTNTTVQVAITATGDYGVTTGSRTVVVGTSGQATFSVSTTDDDVNEPNGTVTATINADNAYDIDSSVNTATATISDNDGPPPITISIADHSVKESDGGFGGTNLYEISLSRPVGEDDNPVSVKWENRSNGNGSGFAAHGTDYTGRSGTLEFGKDEQKKTINLSVRHDTRDEPNETFLLVLSEPNGLVIFDNEAVITIIDDD